MTNRILLAGIVALAAAFVTQSNANAASYQHIDTLALRIQASSSKLHHEFRLHYSHTPEYQHLISDTRGLAYRSKRIHELAHHHGSLQHMARDLRELDRWFHHLKKVLHNIEFDADHGQFGHLQSPAGHVHRLMKQIKCDIRHLREDVEELTEHFNGGHVVYHSGNASVQVIRSRNHGGVRSSWTHGLNNLQQAGSRIVRRIR